MTRHGLLSVSQHPSFLVEHGCLKSIKMRNRARSRFEERDRMNSAIESKQTELAELCLQYRVRQLELFGSAVGSRFNPATSDLDFLVEFEGPRQPNPLVATSACCFALQNLFGRDVDLVETAAIQNPYFLRSIANDRVLLYAA